MAVGATEIKRRFPEFGCLDDDVLTRWITEAEAYVGETQWAAKYNDGVAYLTAHLLTCFESEAVGSGEPGAGPIASEREGSVAVSYALASVFTKDSMGATKYGRRFAEIRKIIFVTRCI